MANRSFLLLALGVVSSVAFVGAGCTQTPEATETETVQPAQQTQQETSSSSAGTSTSDTTVPAVQEVSMIAKQWEFEPAQLMVKKGRPVRLSIASTDVAHGFSLEGATSKPVSVTLRPGKTATVEFTPENVGTFTYSCSVLCGQGHNDMEGQLTVQE